MKNFICLFLVLIVTQLTLGCGPTTLLMKDGRQLRGMVTSSDANQIQLKSVDEVSGLSVTEGSVMSVNRSDVQDVEFSGHSAAKTGMWLTIVGSISAIAGGAMLADAGGWDFGKVFIGGGMFFLGVPTTLVGIPLWIGGSSKQRKQRKLYESDETSVMFQTPKQSGTYNLTLRF